jgi:hypothetical protein
VIPSLEEAIVAIHLDLLNRLDDIREEAGEGSYWWRRITAAMRGETE